MTRDLVCIICPRGCNLKVELEGKEIKGVTGNGCPRGLQYAENECLNPQRTVTSTIRCTDGRPVSVKTDRAIPKDKVFECMKMINSAIVPLPIHIGDVMIKDVFGSNVVATENIE